MSGRSPPSKGLRRAREALETDLRRIHGKMGVSFGELEGGDEESRRSGSRSNSCGGGWIVRPPPAAASATAWKLIQARRDYRDDIKCTVEAFENARQTACADLILEEHGADSEDQED
jgi:hypothetical protein